MGRNVTVLEIRDLGLAAALISCDFEMRGTERDEDGRTLFVFVHSPKLARAVQRYWGDTLQVKARTYFDNTKMLKTRIYSER